MPLLSPIAIDANYDDNNIDNIDNNHIIPTNNDMIINNNNSDSGGDVNNDIINNKGDDDVAINNELKKNTLSLTHCLAMSISGIGPTCGLYFVVGQIAKVAGANVPFTLILATICCLSMASTISTFGNYIYSSASFYCYVSEGLGGTMGFITGWFMLVGYGILTVQTVIQFSSWTSDVFMNDLSADVPWVVFAAIVLVLIGSLAYIGINPALKISLVLVCCETVILLVLTVIIVAKGGAEGNYPLAFTPVGKYSGGFGGLSTGLVFSILVFVGFESAAILGAETKNPRRTIPQAVVGSVLITSTWMTWGMYAVIIAVGPSNAFTLYEINSPMHVFAKKYIGQWFAYLIDIAGISTTFNVCTVSFNNMYRILYSLGKADMHPSFNLLAKTSVRFKTPLASIIFFTIAQAVFVIIIAACFGLKTTGSWKAYGYLSYIGTLPLIFVFIFTNIAVIFYVKNKHPQDFHRFYHLALPIFSGLLFVIVLFGNFYPDYPTPPNSYWLIFLGVAMLAGIILALVLRSKKGMFENMLLMIQSGGEETNSEPKHVHIQ
ncbi:hypothetical protein SAMD00019534_080050 [Acytostelium subglobosum LB1]|uniref:hypothetical protein n=1 Tax=Acytostelium subglobosum LB1 TaxID=1410327 RepID=UPI000644CAB7|nr:hypothetical protein SAMD00019534_080050 [Acytostelium subglobosum LB1]GAM24830.1 hypothetical protein SAMD00019534_080050 [Acytostelium subglobosum LB1]|eukprot:XP_012752499.1 hypothetical protein SAMD00019534_080050 [Acytostelium subglobosum LB1]